MKLLQSKLIAPFMEKEVKKDLIFQKLTLFTLMQFLVLVPIVNIYGWTWELLWRVELYAIFLYAWIMLLYGATFLLKPEKDSYHRWILFIASATNLPLAINIAVRASAGMQNKVTKAVSQVLTFIVSWYILVQLFIQLSGLISRALGIA